MKFDFQTAFISSSYLVISLGFSVGTIVLVSPDRGMHLVDKVRGVFVENKVDQPTYPVTVNRLNGEWSLGIIPITISKNGKETTCRAIVDTGSEYTVVPASVIEKLGLKIQDETKHLTVNGEKNAYTVEPITISVGEARVENLPAITNLKMSEVNNPSEPFCLLGQPFLRHFKFTQTPTQLIFEKP